MGTFILGPKPVNWCSPGLVTPWTSGVCSPLWAQSSHLYSGDGGFQRGLSPPSCSVRGFPEGSLGLAWGNSSNHCHASPKPCSVPGSPPQVSSLLRHSSWIQHLIWQLFNACSISRCLDQNSHLPHTCPPSSPSQEWHLPPSLPRHPSQHPWDTSPPLHHHTHSVLSSRHLSLHSGLSSPSPGSQIPSCCLFSLPIHSRHCISHPSPPGCLQYKNGHT